MRLLIGDTFLESLVRLPKPIQKKAIEFQQKFRENPRSAAINLEKISTFVDTDLRTARVDNKYRAIIGQVPNSEDFFLLWVDNHDEAMDWASKRRFNWNSFTNSPQLFTVSANVPEPTATEILPEQSISPLATEDEFRKLGVPETWLSSVNAINTIEDLERLETHLPKEVFEVLFYLIDGVPVARILEEIEENSKTGSDGISFNTKRYFIQANDEELQRWLDGGFEHWQVFLHPSQRRLVEGSYPGSVKVTGGAGTGKTVAALHRLKWLTNSLADGGRILFATYTNALADNLKVLAGQLGVPNAAFTISTIDKLAVELAKAEGILLPSSRLAGYGFEGQRASLTLWDEVLSTEVTDEPAEFYHAETQRVIYLNDLKTESEYLNVPRSGLGKPVSRLKRKQIWKLYQRYELLKKERNHIDRSELFNRLSSLIKNKETALYSHVIVDEVQDCSTIELRFLRSLVKEGANDLFLVGDPFQSIYKRHINFTQAGINIRGRRSFRLKVNYRTTDEVRKLALAILKNVHYDDFDGSDESLKGYISLFHGARPEYHIFKTSADEVAFIVERINELKKSGLSHLPDIVVASRTKDGIKEIKSLMHRNSMPYYDVRLGEGSMEGVRLSTFHSLKGLEFRWVILTGVNDRTLPLLPSNYNDLPEFDREQIAKEEQSLFYVACTRAMAGVLMTGVGSKSDIVGL